MDELAYHWLEPNSALNIKLIGIDFPLKHWLQLTYAEGANAVCPAEGILPDGRATKPSKLLSTIDEDTDEEGDDDEYIFASMLGDGYNCSRILT